MNLLHEEMQRTVRFFAYHEGLWTRRAEDADVAGDAAAAAYDRK